MSNIHIEHPNTIVVATINQRRTILLRRDILRTDSGALGFEVYPGKVFKAGEEKPVMTGCSEVVDKVPVAFAEFDFDCSMEDANTMIDEFERTMIGCAEVSYTKGAGHHRRKSLYGGTPHMLNDSRIAMREGGIHGYVLEPYDPIIVGYAAEHITGGMRTAYAAITEHGRELTLELAVELHNREDSKALRDSTLLPEVTGIPGTIQFSDSAWNSSTVKLKHNVLRGLAKAMNQRLGGFVPPDMNHGIRLFRPVKVVYDLDNGEIVWTFVSRIETDVLQALHKLKAMDTWVKAIDKANTFAYMDERRAAREKKVVVAPVKEDKEEPPKRSSRRRPANATPKAVAAAKKNKDEYEDEDED